MIVGTIVVSIGAVALPVLGGILLAPRGGYLAAAHSERSRNRPENWTFPRRRLESIVGMDSKGGGPPHFQRNQRCIDFDLICPRWSRP
jgi:hypothetical protein